MLAALIRKSTTRELLFLPNLLLYGPEELACEVTNHIKYDAEILEKTKLSREELLEIFNILLSRIEIIEKKKFARHLPKALEIAPHKEDAPFIALSMFLNCPLWTNDSGIDKLKVISVITTSEIVRGIDL